MLLVSLCSVWFIRWVCRFGSWLFILFLIFVLGVSVVIELIIMMFIELECISMLVIFSVCLLVLGWDSSRLLMFMFSLVVQIGFSVCLVLMKVVVLFFFWYLVIVCRVRVVLFEDFGLQIFMICFLGRLLMLSVMFSISELVGMILIVLMMWLFMCMIEFLLNCFLIWFRVVVNVCFLFLFIVLVFVEVMLLEVFFLGVFLVMGLF